MKDDRFLDDTEHAESTLGDLNYWDLSNSYAFAEQQAGEVFKTQNWISRNGKRNRDEFLAHDTLRRFEDLIGDSLARAGLPSNTVTEMAIDEQIALIDDIPTCHVQYAIRCVHHDNPQLTSKRGDMEDVSWLSVAIVCCDIVVMEKHHADLARRAGLEKKYDTLILSDLVDLARHIQPTMR